MMKKIAMFAASAALVTLLSACSSDYVMTTNSGEVLISQGKPVLDEETGMMSYTDQGGDQRQVRSEDIKEMVEK